MGTGRGDPGAGWKLRAWQGQGEHVMDEEQGWWRGRGYRPPGAAGLTTAPKGPFQDDAAHVCKTCVFLSDKNRSLSLVANPAIKFSFQM